MLPWIDPPAAPVAWRAILVALGFIALGAVVVIAAAARGRPAPAPRPDGRPRVPLGRRFGTLLVLAVLVLGPAYLGGWIFAGVVALMVVLGLGEFWNASVAGGVRPYARTGTAAGLALVVGAEIGGVAGLGAIVVATLVALLARSVIGEQQIEPTRIGATLLGVAYVAGLGAFLLLLRTGEDGFARLWLVLFVVQLADAFALLGGMMLGRRRLALRLSPGKTWEGAACGLLGGIAGAWLLAPTIPGARLPALLGAAAVIAISGMIGDLVASGFKRAAGIKDFGRVLPGHGGVLDRFDGYLLAAPIAYALFVLVPWLK